MRKKLEKATIARTTKNKEGKRDEIRMKVKNKPEKKKGKQEHKIELNKERRLNGD